MWLPAYAQRHNLKALSPSAHPIPTCLFRTQLRRSRGLPYLATYLPNRQRVALAIAELFGRERAYIATDLMPMKLLSLHALGAESAKPIAERLPKHNGSSFMSVICVLLISPR